jgi:Lon-like protease
MGRRLLILPTAGPNGSALANTVYVMSRRGVTLIVVSVLIVVLAAVGFVMPVPYVALSPGPTENTLGKNDQGVPLIQIQGRQVYTDTGHLNFTTVAYQGGPENPIDLFTALRGWLSSDTAVVPQEAIFPPSQSTKQVQQQDVQQMAGSQQNATAAALTELKIPFEKIVVVASVTKGMPADGKLLPGDQLVAIDGTKTATAADVIAVMKPHKPGDKIVVTVKRAGKDLQIPITTVASQDGRNRAVMGILPGPDFRFPLTVKISVGDIGGPSAGLMFSLGIYDKLAPGGLTGGKFVAGTGTIDPSGTVGPIGGIQQKMIAARDAGATIFLTPKDNCKEAVPAAPSGLRLVRADTMDGAVKALEALRANPAAQLPTCS